MQTVTTTKIFSRETLDAWKRIIFDKRTAWHRSLAASVSVTLLHALLFVLFLYLENPIDLSKIKSGAPVSVRFVDKSAEVPSGRGQVVPPPVRRGTPRPVPRTQAPQPEWLTKNNGQFAIPVEPEAIVPTAQATPAVPDIGPQIVSPGLRDLLPNSNTGLQGNARHFGENWGQQNDETGDGDAGQAIDVQTREFKYASYFQGLIRQIEQVWVYPELAARSSMQGQAIYDIVIRRDGTLQKLVAVKSSGFLVLDSEVERAVRAAGPYNPIPSRIDKDPLVIRIRFVYTLTRFGIF